MKPKREGPSHDRVSGLRLQTLTGILSYDNPSDDRDFEEAG